MGNAAQLQIVEREEVQTSTGDGGGEKPLTKGEVRKFKKLAKLIRDAKHLAAILNQVPAENREAIYQQIAPWVNFTPPGFENLEFF